MCSCNLAGRLNAFVQPSNGQRCVFSSDGYLDDVTERGVAGVASWWISSMLSASKETSDSSDVKSAKIKSETGGYGDEKSFSPSEGSACFAIFEGFPVASLVAFRLKGMLNEVHYSEYLGVIILNKPTVKHAPPMLCLKN